MFLLVAAHGKGTDGVLGQVVVRAQPVPLLADTLSEFRIVSDGNTVTRKDPAGFAACQQRLRDRARACLETLGHEALYAGLLRFPISLWPTDEEGRQIVAHTLEMLGTVR